MSCRRARAGLPAAFLLAIAGCVGLGWRGYPHDWPPQVNAAPTECPRLEGEWENAPEEDPLRAKAIFLQSLVWPGSTSSDSSAERIRLAWVGSTTLEVELWTRGDDAPSTARLQRGADFACAGGTLAVDLSGGGARYHEESWGSVSRTAALSLDTEGHLVARVRSGGALLVFFVVPVLAREIDWARYRRAAPQDERSPAH